MNTLRAEGQPEQPSETVRQGHTVASSKIPADALSAQPPSDYEQIARWLVSSRRAVVFTGAGISTESGIPDFRSPGGVWTKYRMIYFDEFLHSARARYEYWQQKAEAHRDFAHAQPNAGHRIVAQWESRGWIRGVITQNIDGLHQEAGSKNVLELHGTARWVACLTCHARFPSETYVEQFLREDRVPLCPDCGGFLKHAVISFGQSLDPAVLQTAIEWASEADLMLVVGSSLVVHPAAGIPECTVRAGGKLVIINRDDTPLDAIAHRVVRSEAGAVLTAVDQLCQQLLMASH
jgi:NAD-dependent deacetylase